MRSAVMTFTVVITVAAGAFAPGHLGELTRIVPFELATTLLDCREHPADALVRLYHERWEHEVACLDLRHTLLTGRNLRSGDPAGAEQEMWALLALYQALRTAVADAVQSVPGTDPDRASRAVAVSAAQDLVTSAANVAAAKTTCRAPSGAPSWTH